MTAQLVDQEPAASGGGMAGVLRQRDFRLLWIGQGTSLLGDQFYMIALPWLVLQLTHDPLALGLVLAMAGIPRALFMLLGGAVTDRFSPRLVMLVSDAIRLICIAAVGFLVISGGAQMWMLYALSLVFGIVSGFFLPASNAIVPALVEDRDLQVGNAIFQGTAQLSAFVGPALAGALIAWGEHAVGGSASTGIALAFGIDALTFVVSIVTLWMIGKGGHAAAPSEDLLLSIREGVVYAWRDPLLRVLFALLAAMNFFFAGPMLVGIPVMASTRLPEGAQAFGLILSGYAGGMLAGFLAAGSLSRFRRVGLVTPPLLSLFGVGLIGLAFVMTMWAGFAILVVLGIADGYLAITIITWMQRRTASAILGRVMSLMLFFGNGLIPLSQALAGAVSKLSITALFVGSGAAIILVAIWSAFQPAMTRAEIEDGTPPAAAAASGS